jgi:hypothetical protein
MLQIFLCLCGRCRRHRRETISFCLSPLLYFYCCMLGNRINNFIPSPVKLFMAYRWPTGRPVPPVARSGRTGLARCGPRRATGCSGRTTPGYGPRPRPMARSVGHFNGPRATRAAFSPGRAMGSPPPLLFPRRARLGCGLWPLILFRMHYSPWTDMLVGLYIFATRLYRSGRLRAARANGPGHLRTAGRGSGPWPARPPGRAARSPQSADRAGPGTGPLLRAMDRAADHGPNGQTLSRRG